MMPGLYVGGVTGNTPGMRAKGRLSNDHAAGASQHLLLRTPSQRRGAAGRNRGLARATTRLARGEQPHQDWRAGQSIARIMETCWETNGGHGCRC